MKKKFIVLLLATSYNLSLWSMQPPINNLIPGDKKPAKQSASAWEKLKKFGENAKDLGKELKKQVSYVAEEFKKDLEAEWNDVILAPIIANSPSASPIEEVNCDKEAFEDNESGSAEEVFLEMPNTKNNEEPETLLFSPDSKNFIQYFGSAIIGIGILAFVYKLVENRFKLNSYVKNRWQDE